MQPLLTTAEAAAHLRLKKPSTAKRKLLALGVRPISLGRGRGLGDRWRPQEIEEALDRTRGENAQETPRRAQKGMILGRDVSTLVRELTAASPRQ